jgi:competence protein ComEA
VRTPYEPARAFSGASAFDPGRRGLLALAAAGTLALLAAAFFLWRPAAGPTPETLPSAAAPSAAAEAPLVVAVSGLVQHPGLVRLPPGSRVADALAAAGGALPEADLSTLNLARKLTDGELIAVGIPDPTGGGPGAPGAKISLNTATLSQLDTLPGVGPVLAQRILDHRAKHGRFRDISELRQIEGIGEETYSKLKDLVVL